jgi:hypothetical protein
VDERGPAQKDGATRLVVASADEDAAKAQRVAQQLVDLVVKTAAAQSGVERACPVRGSERADAADVVFGTEPHGAGRLRRRSRAAAWCCRQLVPAAIIR